MKDYTNITVSDFFLAARNSKPDIPEGDAIAWVEAENVKVIREIVIDWFKSIEDKTVNFRCPDSFSPVTMGDAERMSFILDTEFSSELRERRKELGGRIIPGFTFLFPSQKLALTQEIVAAKKTPVQIFTEAKRRYKDGEKFPPDGWTDAIVSNKLTTIEDEADDATE
jgi:hypothetical protein